MCACALDGVKIVRYGRTNKAFLGVGFAFGVLYGFIDIFNVKSGFNLQWLVMYSEDAKLRSVQEIKVT